MIKRNLTQVQLVCLDSILLKKCIAVLLVLAYMVNGEKVIINDSLTNSTTLGIKYGGSFTSEGYLPTVETGHIFYELPHTVRNGYAEFQIKGMDQSVVVSDGDHGFFGMYDGRGVTEPATYSEYFKDNFFRWNLHWRQNRAAFKCVLTLSEEDQAMFDAALAVNSNRDWSEEPMGQSMSWDPAIWYTIKVEWNNKQFKVLVDGVEKWSVEGPYDYAPVTQRLWLGSAPNLGNKYANLVPGITYRNFKLIDYDKSDADTTVDTTGTTDTTTVEPSGDVGKYRRYKVTLKNSSYTGNPFELEVDGTFTHTASGKKIMLPGYYDGNDTWEIGFMPTEIGEWTYTTSSVDPELNGKLGSLNCVASGLPGMLAADPAHPKKWKFSDGPYVVPIALRQEFFSEPGTIEDFTKGVDFIAANNIQMFETRLIEEYGIWDGGRYDYVFEGNWTNHKFDLEIWDRMEKRMEVLTERGVGAHVMFYSDDKAEPDWQAKSATEALVIRYVVARLAGYPILWFNSGIDIGEYRNADEIAWWGDKIQENDPYGHPVSSRHGGGTGALYSNQVFNSEDHPNQAIIGDMISYYNQYDVPVSMDDAWGENRGSHEYKDHTAEDIRRAFWKCVMAGGVGGLLRGGGDGGEYTGFYYIGHVEGDLESEQWLKHINPFVQKYLGRYFGTMEPTSSIVNNGYGLTDPANDVMLFWKAGVNDSYDAGNGGDLTLKLSGVTGNFSGGWYDTRKGEFLETSKYTGGNDHMITPPSTDDWVFLLIRDDVTSITPEFKRSKVGQPGYQLGIGGTSHLTVNKNPESSLFDIRGKRITSQSHIIQIFKTGEMPKE
ncbi:MAG: DUF5060 domain-containing protein [Fibrobacteria bacterium]|nr:DUF5060 domain-containing protein [Fibrobacteria bacterium]